MRLPATALPQAAEAQVVTTSTWQKEKVSPEIIEHVIDGYAKVRPNLLKHAAGWPTPEHLRGRVKSRQPAYGLLCCRDETPSRCSVAQLLP